VGFGGRCQDSGGPVGELVNSGPPPPPPMLKVEEKGGSGIGPQP
jgi:hypothetical protein